MEATPVQSQRVAETRRRLRLGWRGHLLYRAARWARRRLGSARDQTVRTTSTSRYRDWRMAELGQQLTEHFPVQGIANRDVLDFGCGTGELTRLLAEHQAKSVTGVDMSSDAIGKARESCVPCESSIRFLCNETEDVIPCDDSSVDLICCFDVVEHIPNMPAIAGQWRRVLRPNGRIWIWWSPWKGPYGHHLDSLIPLPWVHLLCPEKTLFETCAELYDDPEFTPRIWDRDPATGAKKPNKWRAIQSCEPFLNKITRPQFETCAAEAGLRIVRCETHGFSGSPLSRATRVLLPLPLIGECFVSYYIYELAPA